MKRSNKKIKEADISIDTDLIKDGNASSFITGREAVDRLNSLESGMPVRVKWGNAEDSTVRQSLYMGKSENSFSSSVYNFFDNSGISGFASASESFISDGRIELDFDNNNAEEVNSLTVLVKDRGNTMTESKDLKESYNGTVDQDGNYTYYPDIKSWDDLRNELKAAGCDEFFIDKTIKSSEDCYNDPESPSTLETSPICMEFLIGGANTSNLEQSDADNFNKIFKYFNYPRRCKASYMFDFCDVSEFNESQNLKEDASDYEYYSGQLNKIAEDISVLCREASSAGKSSLTRSLNRIYDQLEAIPDDYLVESQSVFKSGSYIITESVDGNYEVYNESNGIKDIFSRKSLRSILGESGMKEFIRFKKNKLSEAIVPASNLDFAHQELAIIQSEVEKIAGLKSEDTSNELYTDLLTNLDKVIKVISDHIAEQPIGTVVGGSEPTSTEAVPDEAGLDMTTPDEDSIEDDGDFDESQKVGGKVLKEGSDYIDSYASSTTISDALAELRFKPSEFANFIADDFDEHAAMDSYEDEKWNDCLSELSGASKQCASIYKAVEDKYSDIWTNRDNDEE